MPNLRKIIDGKDPGFPEFFAQDDAVDSKAMAKHVSNHITDPLEQTKEGFEGLTNAKLNYEMEKEKMRRQLLPVQSVIQHVNQLHQLQDQYGTHPVDPEVQNDANMGYQEERQGVPPNMQQTPGMMQQSNPNRNTSYPGAGPKIPTPPMGAQPGQPQSKGAAPKPPGSGKAFPKANKKPGAKAPGPGQGRGVDIRVKAANMSAPGASTPLRATFAGEKVRQMSSKCKMDAEGAQMSKINIPNPGMSRTAAAPRMPSSPGGMGRGARMGEAFAKGKKRMSAKKKAEDDVEAKAPPGWEGTVKHMKKHPEIDNPYALSWWMKDKGDTPHHMESGGQGSGCRGSNCGRKPGQVAKDTLNKMGRRYPSGAFAKPVADARIRSAFVRNLKKAGHTVTEQGKYPNGMHYVRLQPSGSKSTVEYTVSQNSIYRQ